MAQRPLITGVLLDVSSSMRTNIGNQQNEAQPWSRSILESVNTLIAEDVSPNNLIFALAFGGNTQERSILNILSTMQQYREQERRQDNQEREELIAALINQFYPRNALRLADTFLNQLQRNGAPNIRTWTSAGQISRVVDFDNLLRLYAQWRLNPVFRQQLVNNILPEQCRGGFVTGTVDLLQSTPFFIGNLIRLATAANNQQIQNLVRRTRRFIQNYYAARFQLTFTQTDLQRVFNVHQAQQILNLTNQQSQNQNQRQAQNLLQRFQPYIYGQTPFYGALQQSINTFQRYRNAEYKKLLIIVSDGISTDQGNLEALRQQLQDQNVTVVSCYISNSNTIEAQKLFCSSQNNWQQGGRLMFNLSSTIQTTQIPAQLLARRGWRVETTDNQVRLFVHANNPNNIRSVCSLANDIVFRREALSEIINEVDLSQYINGQLDLRRVTDQHRTLTCYAHASSSVLHMAMKRIRGRQGGYPELQTIRQDLIQQYGDNDNGADLQQLLERNCGRYRLRYREINIQQAKRAISMKRPVLAGFQISQWTAFSTFYQNNRQGILTREELNRNPVKAIEQGHAVVLVQYGRNYLKFMNSWGTDFGDQGFFKVSNTEVLNLYYFDVFWYENNLRPSEKEYFRNYGQENTKRYLQTLQGLSRTQIQCPACHRNSLVSQFTGTVLQVRCPLCENTFLTEGRNILALNCYLNSAE